MNPFPSVYIYFALLIPATVLAFATSFFAGETFSGKSLTVVLNVHAALMALWLLMLIAPAWFIRTMRYRVHRWVGRSSYVIAPVIILATLAAIHEGFNRTPDGISAEDARIDVFGFGQILAFGVTWGSRSCIGNKHRRTCGSSSRRHLRLAPPSCFGSSMPGCLA